jgi:hypothetical protein
MDRDESYTIDTLTDKLRSIGILNPGTIAQITDLLESEIVMKNEFVTSREVDLLRHAQIPLTNYAKTYVGVFSELLAVGNTWSESPQNISSFVLRKEGIEYLARITMRNGVVYTGSSEIKEQAKTIAIKKMFKQFYGFVLGNSY